MDERVKARTRQLLILEQMQALLQRLKLELRKDHELLTVAAEVETTIHRVIGDLQRQAEGTALVA